MKKFVIALLLCTALCVAVFAQTGDGFEITQNKQGGITITRYLNGPINVVIPSTIEGIKVTEIGKEAFYTYNITSVIIPNGVTNIADGDEDYPRDIGAFAFCRSLTSVTIGNSVTSIGDYAFYACTSLTSITIPNSVTRIGKRAFDCLNLNSVTIGNNVTQFGKDALPNNFADFYIGQGKKAGTYMWSGRLWRVATAADTEQAREVEAFAQYAAKSGFLAAKKNDTGVVIKKYVGQEPVVVIPSIILNIPVIEIGEKAFYECSSLKSLTIPNSVTSIGSSAFYGCSSLASVTIPNNVTSIGHWAFQDCTRLASVTIPASVNSIGVGAFFGCNNLTNVTFETGSNITNENFGNKAFPEYYTQGFQWENNLNYLKTAYATGKAGTYTRAANGSTWTKQ